MSSPFETPFRDLPLVVAQDANFVAFIEPKPLVLGHVVVVPRRAEDHFFDLSEGELAELMRFARPIARAIRATIACEKVGAAALGLVARQAHLHLVPVTTADDLNFTREKLSPPRAELVATAERLRDALRRP